MKFLFFPALALFSCFGTGLASAAELAPSAQIDQLIDANLDEHGIAANAPIDDATFLRRVYLNIGGRIPTIEEAEAFHSSTYENKRERLIEDVLGSEAFVSNFYHFWADLLRINSELDGGIRPAYELWVKNSIRDNRPYDEMVRELVTAQGKFWDNGATGYYFRDRGMPLDNMSNTVRIFLGTRLECAQCHNHPFDEWTQLDYFKMAAFSYGMSSKNYDQPNRTEITQVIRTLGRDAYRAEALRLSGIENFPLLENDKAIEKFLAAKGARVTERGKIKEKVKAIPPKGERADKVARETAEARQKRKERRETGGFLAEHDLTEKQFRKIVASAQSAAKNAAEQSDGMRQAVKELYDPLRYTGVLETDKNPQLPHDYQYSDADPHDTITAETLFGSEIDLDQGDEKIDAYADWMTSPENPRFTTVIVNRLWKEVFGMGIVEPVDEFTAQTQLANPELLAFLEDLMKELDYDVKGFLQVLYNTEAYQRAADSNEIVLGEPYHFQGPILRRMSAEQIWDSVVALALPEADHYRPKLKKDLAAIERQRLIYTSLEERPFEEFRALVEDIAPLIEEQSAIQNRIRNQITKAQASDDMKRYAELRQELKVASKAVKEKIADVGYIHLREKVDADDLLAAMGMNEVSMGMMNRASESDDSMVVTELPKIRKERMPKGLDKREAKAWAREAQADMQIYRNLIAGMARASELESPARRGHFLRDFGQSDREVIENAADHASVPQALNLLNGKIVEALTNEYSTFGRRVHGAGDPEEKTRMIFQAMLTREPTEQEMELAKAEVEHSGDDAYEGLVWALLNTQQFMFVQ